jgi:hypothetical protein
VSIANIAKLPELLRGPEKLDTGALATPSSGRTHQPTSLCCFQNVPYFSPLLSWKRRIAAQPTARPEKSLGS